VAGGQGLGLGDEGGALGGVDHVDEVGVADDGREQIGRVVPGLAGGAVLVDLKQQRAEPPQGGAIDGEALVDDDAGDLLLPAAAQDPGLVGVLGEALGGGDHAHRGQERAGVGGTRAAEGQIVGVAGVREPELPGGAGQARVEAPAHDVGDHRAGRRALGQLALAARDVEGLAVECRW
jgi:hypothetical protein